MMLGRKVPRSSRITVCRMPQQGSPCAKGALETVVASAPTMKSGHRTRCPRWKTASGALTRLMSLTGSPATTRASAS
jgi:hypothetical protein